MPFQQELPYLPTRQPEEEKTICRKYCTIISNQNKMLLIICDYEWMYDKKLMNLDLNSGAIIPSRHSNKFYFTFGRF